MKIYVFGNGTCSFKNFVKHYTPLLEEYAEHQWILCDFRGLDTLAQEWLKTVSSNVTIVHCFEQPRYLADKSLELVKDWIIKGGFQSDKERDDWCINECDAFIAFDFVENRKSGTKKLIEKLTKIKTQLK
jgi:hypothetical protein